MADTFLKEDEVLINKPSKREKRDLFLKAAGAWRDIDAGKRVEIIYRARKDNSSFKEFLAGRK